MHDSSSSQEIEIDYINWNAADCPDITIRRRVMEGIDHEVREVFAAVPRRGAETGGILLGRREAERVVIEDFEPVPSEHRFGPSYRLSDTDHQLLRETLEWFRAGAPSGLTVLGFYRSHTLPEFGLGEHDEELLRAHFPDSDPLVLLIKPNRTGGSMADFFVRRNGHIDEAAVPAPFPFNGAPPVPADPEQPVESIEPERAPAEPESPAPEPAAISWPPPRPRLILDTPPPRPRTSWLWYTAAAALGIIGGAFGYLSFHPEIDAARPPVRIARNPAPAPAPAASAAAPVPERELPPAAAGRGGENPDPSETGSAGIHGLLSRWSDALKRGDVQAAAECYVPVVTSYYGRRNVARDAVQQSIKHSLMRNGHLDIFRISDLQITPVGDSRAVVTFRKHWQTSGYRKFAGEEQDRLSLVRTRGVWQIASEQDQRLYWFHKPARY